MIGAVPMVYPPALPVAGALLTRSPLAPKLAGPVLGGALPLLVSAALGSSGWGLEAAALAAVLGAHLLADWNPSPDNRFWLGVGILFSLAYLLLVPLRELKLWQYSLTKPWCSTGGWLRNTCSYACMADGCGNLLPPPPMFLLRRCSS